MTKFGTKRQDCGPATDPGPGILNPRMRFAVILLLSTVSFILSATAAGSVKHVGRIPPGEIVAAKPNADIYVPYDNVAELIDPSQKAIPVYLPD